MNIDFKTHVSEIPSIPASLSNYHPYNTFSAPMSPARTEVRVRIVTYSFPSFILITHCLSFGTVRYASRNCALKVRRIAWAMMLEGRYNDVSFPTDRKSAHLRVLSH